MADLKKLAEEIVGLTLLEAQELKTILKDEYGIEPAAGGAVMMAGPAAEAGPAADPLWRLADHRLRAGRCRSDPLPRRPRPRESDPLGRPGGTEYGVSGSGRAICSVGAGWEAVSFR